jgi:Ca2+-binding EF-hand superfamily protein
MHADPALRRMLVERFDRNHDGRLEPGERRHAVRALRRLERKLARQDRRDARLRKVIRKYDLDGDGNVGPGEMPPAMAKRLRHLDHDGNGWVDDADFAR